MSPFAIQLMQGCLESDIEQEDQNSFQALQQLGAIEEQTQDNGMNLWKLGSLCLFSSYNDYSRLVF